MIEIEIEIEICFFANDCQNYWCHASINITTYLLTRSLVVTYLLLALVTGDKKQYNPSPIIGCYTKSLFVCLCMCRNSCFCFIGSCVVRRVRQMCRKAEKVSEKLKK